MKTPFVLIAFLFVALTASADTLTFIGTGSNIVGSDYAYPYYFTVDGVDESLMCLSFNNHITVGESWTTFEVPLTTPAELEAAWALNSAVLNPANADDAQLLAWSLFANDVTLTPGAEVLLSQAEAGYTSINPADFILYVPTGDANSPDYPQVQLGEASPVSEPLSLFLLGSGLLVLVVVKGKVTSAYIG